MAAEENGDPPVPGLRTMEELYQPSLNGRDTFHLPWFDRFPRNSINTLEQMAKMFLGKYFPPSMVTKLRNEITNFRQRPDESLFEMNTTSSSGSGTLPGNIITNPKEDLKGITTRSGNAYQGPTIPTTSSSLPKIVELENEVTKYTVPPTNNGSTKDVQPSVVQTETPKLNSEPVVALIIEPVAAPVSAPKPNQKPSIPYPSRLHDQKLRDKANDQKEKFFQIFQDLNFNISFADALILISKFGTTIKTLLTNKDKLSELARTPLNEHCSAVLLKKFLEKLGDPEKFLIPWDPEKFLIPCDFLRMDECLGLADLGASINLMPLSVWNKLSLPELSHTCMTLELADRSISRPVRVVEDVFVKELKICEAKNDKSSIDEPPEVELKDLSPYLKYVFLEGDDELPGIIAKELSFEEKAALIKVLKSHKKAIAWKPSDIKGINPEFYTHKILMEDDFEPAEKSHFMVKEGIVLGHKISKNRIEVDKAKVDVIAKLPHPTTVKGGVFTAKKPLTFSRLATMDPPGDIMARTTPPRRFGTPRSIISDCGTHFYNDQFAKVMLKYDVTHRLATAYHPQTTFKTPIECTLYKLVYGKACHLPIELEHKAYWVLKHANFNFQTAGNHRKVQLSELNELRDQAYENSLIYKEKTKRIHDSKIKDRVFNVGDRVLLYNSRLKIFSGKLMTRWSGPFTITHVFPYCTVELSQTDGPHFKLNGHRRKHYFREDIPKMVVPDLQTFPKDK
nr:reverse transcriptase domain-containing protein [Tanacetum cinerariifolium]